MDQDMIKQKVEFLFKKRINIHVMKEDGQFYNGIILEHSDKHLIMVDRVVGDVFIFYSEIKKIDNFKGVMENEDR